VIPEPPLRVEPKPKMVPPAAVDTQLPLRQANPPPATETPPPSEPVDEVAAGPETEPDHLEGRYSYSNR